MRLRRGSLVGVDRAEVQSQAVREAQPTGRTLVQLQLLQVDRGQAGVLPVEVHRQVQASGRDGEHQVHHLARQQPGTRVELHVGRIQTDQQHGDRPVAGRVAEGERAGIPEERVAAEAELGHAIRAGPAAAVVLGDGGAGVGDVDRATPEVAVLRGEKEILSNIISSQIKLHQPHGGVVPELASRSHLESLPIVVEEATRKAGIQLQDLNSIAVTTSPGLIGCLLVGLSYAKSLAYALGIPLTCVHHLKAHLFSAFLENPEQFPFLGLVVSGGHTAIYHVKGFDKIECI